jgi:hypothetical protein
MIHRFLTWPSALFAPSDPKVEVDSCFETEDEKR